MELHVDIKKKLHGFKLNVNFDAGRDATGLLGASGSGKSMTLRCIAGIEKPDKGRIVLNGRVLFDCEKGINVPSRERKVGFLFQNYALFPNMTVEQNIGFALDQFPKVNRNVVVKQKIEMMKLDGLEKRYPFQLSGGQQQRVALARALSIEPEVLLLDEPFSALDNHLRNVLSKQLIDTLANYNGVTLFVTHNMEDAYQVCGKLVVLKNGGVEALGNTEELFQSPPTMAAAQITGCKNFSTAKLLSKNQIFATDWGINLEGNKPSQVGLGHVGIRAHYIREASENDHVNVFPCWPSFVSQAPFTVTIYLSIGREPTNGEEFQLQWEISKEKWVELRNQPLPWRICLSPEKLLVFD